MENISGTANFPSSSLIKINQMVNENLQKTWRIQAHIKYTNVELENLNKEIKDLQAKINPEMHTSKSLEENLGHALKIKESDILATDFARKMHPQLLQRKIDEKNKLREWAHEFESTYDEHLKKIEDSMHRIEIKNPLLKELHAAKAEVSKSEFDRKLLNEEINDARGAYELKKEIYQKFFYASVITFVQAVSKHHNKENIMNQLRDYEGLLEEQQQQCRRKYLEKENNRALDKISNKANMPTLTLQLPTNLMGNTYQSVLSEIPLRSSRQTHEMSNADFSSVSRSKRPCEILEVMKRVKKKITSQSSLVPKICNKTQPPGIMKKHVENQNVNDHITSSQNSVSKQVVFNIKDNRSTEKSSLNNKTMNKSQEKITQSQSDKPQLLSSTKQDATASSFILNSQTQKKSKQVITTQNRDLKFPGVLSSFGFASHEKDNKQPKQQTVNDKIVESPESILKPSNFSKVEDQNNEFSPYFATPLVRKLQPDENDANEEPEKVKNVTVSKECENEAEQYSPYDFLTPQEDELNATQNITFLGEDRHMDNGEEQSGFLFNLGRPSSQSAFRPFSFFK